MKYGVPIDSFSSRGLKNLIFSLYNKDELLSKATGGHFCITEKFCHSIGDEVFLQQLSDKIQGADESLLIGLKLENRTEDYDGDLVFTGFVRNPARPARSARPVLNSNLSISSISLQMIFHQKRW